MKGDDILDLTIHVYEERISQIDAEKQVLDAGKQLVI